MFANRLNLFIILLCTVGCSHKYPPLNKTFRFAWSSAPRTTDPRYSMDADSQYLGELIHCSLIKFDINGKIKNDLATNLNWITPTLLEITLNTHFQFWNQQIVTAEDVKANFDFFLQNSGSKSPLKSNFQGLTKVETFGPNKIRFTLSEPDGDFIYNLSQGLLPKKLALGPRITNQKMAATCGLFKIDEWALDHVQLKRVKEDENDVQNIRIEIVKDENTRFLKLRNSELDLVQNTLNLDQLTQIEEFKNLKLLRKSGNNITYLGFQLRDPILGRPVVRQAISAAIDRKKIIHHVLHDWAVPAQTLLNPLDPYYNTHLRPTEFSQNHANQLLEEAGYPWGGNINDPPRFKLQLKTANSPSSILLGKSISDELSKVGIQVELQNLDWGKFKKDIEQGAAQMWLLNWIGYKGPDLYRLVFASGSFPPQGANRGRYSNPKLDQVLRKAKSELDFRLRKKFFGQAQEIVQKDFPYVFLWHEDKFAVINRRVKNFELSADGSLSSISNVHFSESSEK